MTTSRRLQRGMSLIEILVSLVIGLVVVGAVLVNYSSTGLTGARNAAVGQMTEDAQLAFSLIARDLQMAGYSEPTAIAPPAVPGQPSTFARKYSGRSVFACANNFANAQAALAAATYEDNTTCAAGAGSHSVVANFQATKDNTIVNAANVPTDCLGNALTPVAGGFYMSSNRYYVANSASGRPELHCAAPGQAGQPLIENVHTMRIWLGEANAASPRNAVRYVTPDLVGDWGRVVSARICVLMRSAEPVLTSEDTDQYLDCTGTAATSPDRRLYRAFFSTVSFRNKTAF